MIRAGCEEDGDAPEAVVEVAVGNLWELMFAWFGAMMSLEAA